MKKFPQSHQKDRLVIASINSLVSCLGGAGLNLNGACEICRNYSQCVKRCYQFSGFDISQKYTKLFREVSNGLINAKIFELLFKTVIDENEIDKICLACLSPCKNCAHCAVHQLKTHAKFREPNKEGQYDFFDFFNYIGPQEILIRKLNQH